MVEGDGEISYKLSPSGVTIVGDLLCTTLRAVRLGVDNGRVGPHRRLLLGVLRVVERLLHQPQELHPRIAQHPTRSTVRRGPADVSECCPYAGQTANVVVVLHCVEDRQSLLEHCGFHSEVDDRTRVDNLAPGDVVRSLIGPGGKTFVDRLGRWRSFNPRQRSDDGCLRRRRTLRRLCHLRHGFLQQHLGCFHGILLPLFKLLFALFNILLSPELFGTFPSQNYQPPFFESIFILSLHGLQPFDAFISLIDTTY